MTLILLDVSGWIYAAHFRHPTLCRTDKTPTGAVYGFTSMLWRFLRNPPVAYTHIAAVFDPSGPGWRAKIDPTYKAHRGEKPSPITQQWDLVREAARSLNIAALEAPGYEADDVIATYCRRGKAASLPVVVVSGDKDMHQLVDTPAVRVFNQYPKLKGSRPHWIDEAGVMERFGVRPRQVIDVQALTGDQTDGYEGIPGIGMKTAAVLVNHYGNLEAVIDATRKNKRNFFGTKRHAGNISLFADRAILAKKLATLDVAADIFVPIEELLARPPDGPVIAEFLTKIESRDLRNRIVGELAGAGVAA